MPREATSRAEWLAAREALLLREKAHTRERDALAEARRALPAMRMTGDYVFQGPDGPESLRDLFDGKSQLLVYHFMYGADWDEGCPSCSFWADNLDGIDLHLAQRDTAFVMVSSAPYPALAAYRARMGWRFKWLSCAGNRFNSDLGVSFSAEELAAGTQVYNYRQGGFGGPEAPGLSAFLRKGSAIWHTYSTYGRGLDGFNGAYQLLDLTAKGRDEDGLPFSMAWLKRRDRY